MDDLEYKIETLDGLGEDVVGDMFALYSRYYDGTSKRQFRDDLSNKQYIVVMRDQQDVMQGFSTVAVTEYSFEGERVRSFFSGDTVVDDRYWGQQALQKAYLHLSGSVKAEAPEVPLYWFFIVMSQRTYRFLGAFFDVFYPTYDRETPAREKALTDLFAGERFGEAYDAESGIISYSTPAGYLNPSWAEIPEKVRNRPDVKFFLERNPGYMKGDELVCLAEISTENFRPLAERLFRKGMDDGI